MDHFRSRFLTQVFPSLVSLRDERFRKQSGLRGPLVVALAPTVLPDDHDLDQITDPEFKLVLGAGREVLKQYRSNFNGLDICSPKQ